MNTLISRAQEEHDRKIRIGEAAPGSPVPPYHYAQWVYDLTLESYMLGTPEMELLHDITDVSRIALIRK